MIVIYQAFMYINWKKLKVKMAVDGIMNSSSVVFDITNFRLSGPVTFRIIHRKRCGRRPPSARANTCL